MDNHVAPIPSTPTQSNVLSPAESQSRRRLLWFAGGLAILIFGIAIGIFSVKFLNQSQSQSQLTPTSSSARSPTPTPTPDPTADWETYTNTNNGYSIKYPQGFLRLICPDEELTLTNRGVDDNRFGPIEMPTCARGGRYTLETKTYESVQPEPQETKYYTIEKKNIFLGGLQAKQYTHTFTNIEVGPFPIWYTIARVDKNGRTFEIYFDDKNSLRLFDQILSTFKFLDQIISWQSYSNENLGFSVDYPSEWRVVESSGAVSSVGFGPKEIPEDVLWGVTIYDKSQTSKEKVINETGNQFSDRKQTSETVNLNGIQATKLTTTTLSHTDWYLETIIVETNTKIYAISNGAISDTTLGSTKGVPRGVTFENFYSTFKLTN